MLLKTLSRAGSGCPPSHSHPASISPKTIIDVGCGTGIIGICLAKEFPHAQVTMVDRDALALAVTEENCRRNGTKNVSVRGSLMLHSTGDECYDLVVSNLPAKAGAPVLAEFFKQTVQALTPQGIGAVVIVLPLAEDAFRWIREAGGRILLQERSKQHAVFHFSADSRLDAPAPASHDSESAVPKSYVRNAQTFTLKKRRFHLKTVYNLPEFDTLSYTTRNTADVLDPAAVKGRLLFWTPVQGHLPAYVLAAAGTAAVLEIHLACRDKLALSTAASNIAGYGRPVHIHHMPAFGRLPGSIGPETVDFLYAAFSPVPEVREESLFWDTACALTASGAVVCVGGKSADIHRLISKRQRFRIETDHRYRGFRSVMLKKVSIPE